MSLGAVLKGFSRTLERKVENSFFDAVHAVERSLTPPTPPSTKALATTQVVATGQQPVTLRFSARAPGADFSKTGKEVAALAVFVDGRYFSTEVALGEQGRNAQYAVNLGVLPKGPHQVELRPARADGPQPVVGAGSLSSEESAGLRSQLQRYAPLLVTRAATGRDGRPTMFHTDVPLELRADVQGDPAGLHLLTYRVTFSDEDGGTSPVDRLKTYGRTVDDEWCYRVLVDAQGQRVDPSQVKGTAGFQALQDALGSNQAEALQGEAFQYGNDDLFATRHQARPFRGLKVGDRPVLRVNSDNNNFDQVTSKLPTDVPRWSPAVVFDASKVRKDAQGRVTGLGLEDGRAVVAKNPLFERLSLAELRREGRAEGLPVDWP